MQFLHKCDILLGAAVGFRLIQMRETFVISLLAGLGYN